MRWGQCLERSAESPSLEALHHEAGLKAAFLFKGLAAEIHCVEFL